MEKLPEKPIYKLSLTDRTINKLINNNAKITYEPLHQVYNAAQVEEGIRKMRNEGDAIPPETILVEEHNSKTLSENMTRIGDPRPHEKCDAHAIISGAHAKAEGARFILAAFNRRIDDPVNGCWLLMNTAAKSEMPTRLKKAMPHSRVHRYKYFQWIDRHLNWGEFERVKNTDPAIAHKKRQELLDCKLVSIAFKLQSGSFPQWVLLRSDQEIPRNTVYR